MHLYILLIPYSLIVLIFLVFALVDLLHIVMHSLINKTSVLVTLFFLLGFFGVLIGSYMKLSTIRWSEPLFAFGAPSSSSLFK